MQRLLHRCVPALPICLLVLVFWPDNGLRSKFYNWTLICYLCKQPDGSIKPKIDIDPNVDDIAEILRVTLQSKSDGKLMTVGRTYSAKEEIVRISPGQGALNTMNLRQEIAAELGRTNRPTDAGELTPAGAANFQETLRVYSAGAAARTVSQLPPLREWLGLIAYILGGALFAHWLVCRVRRAGYRVRGLERLSRNHCPHCGYALSLPEHIRCPECGTKLAEWA